MRKLRPRVHLVRVTNLNSRHRLNLSYIEILARRILDFVRHKDSLELEIIFLGDKGIKLLNKIYKNEDSPTDVLSFALSARDVGIDTCIGTIYISSDTAKKNSKSLGTRFVDELVLYIIHGVLHLTNYDDLTKKQFLRMSNKQESILRELCKKEDLSKVLTRR